MNLSQSGPNKNLDVTVANQEAEYIIDLVVGTGIPAPIAATFYDICDEQGYDVTIAPSQITLITQLETGESAQNRLRFILELVQIIADEQGYAFASTFARPADLDLQDAGAVTGIKSKFPGEKFLMKKLMREGYQGSDVAIKLQAIFEEPDMAGTTNLQKFETSLADGREITQATVDELFTSMLGSPLPDYKPGGIPDKNIVDANSKQLLDLYDLLDIINVPTFFKGLPAEQARMYESLQQVKRAIIFFVTEMRVDVVIAEITPNLKKFTQEKFDYVFERLIIVLGSRDLVAKTLQGFLVSPNISGLPAGDIKRKLSRFLCLPIGYSPIEREEGIYEGIIVGPREYLGEKDKTKRAAMLNNFAKLFDRALDPQIEAVFTELALLGPFGIEETELIDIIYTPDLRPRDPIDVEAEIAKHLKLKVELFRRKNRRDQELLMAQGRSGAFLQWLLEKANPTVRGDFITWLGTAAIDPNRFDTNDAASILFIIEDNQQAFFDSLATPDAVRKDFYDYKVLTLVKSFDATLSVPPATPPINMPGGLTAAQRDIKKGGTLKVGTVDANGKVPELIEVYINRREEFPAVLPHDTYRDILMFISILKQKGIYPVLIDLLNTNSRVPGTLPEDTKKLLYHVLSSNLNPASREGQRVTKISNDMLAFLDPTMAGGTRSDAARSISINLIIDLIELETRVDALASGDLSVPNSIQNVSDNVYSRNKNINRANLTPEDRAEFTRQIEIEDTRLWVAQEVQRLKVVDSANRRRILEAARTRLEQISEIDQARTLDLINTTLMDAIAAVGTLTIDDYVLDIQATRNNVATVVGRKVDVRPEDAIKKEAEGNAKNIDEFGEQSKKAAKEMRMNIEKRGFAVDQPTANREILALAPLYDARADKLLAELQRPSGTPPTIWLRTIVITKLGAQNTLLNRNLELSKALVNFAGNPPTTIRVRQALVLLSLFDDAEFRGMTEAEYTVLFSLMTKFPTGAVVAYNNADATHQSTAVKFVSANMKRTLRLSDERKDAVDAMEFYGEPTGKAWKVAQEVANVVTLTGFKRLADALEEDAKKDVERIDEELMLSSGNSTDYVQNIYKLDDMAENRAEQIEEDLKKIKKKYEEYFVRTHIENLLRLKRKVPLNEYPTQDQVLLLLNELQGLYAQLSTNRGDAGPLKAKIADVESRLKIMMNRYLNNLTRYVTTNLNGRQYRNVMAELDEIKRRYV